jgi:hypothetical protein
VKDATRLKRGRRLLPYSSETQTLGLRLRPRNRVEKFVSNLLQDGRLDPEPKFCGCLTCSHPSELRSLRVAALVNVQHHAFAIDVGDLEPTRLHRRTAFPPVA